MPMCQGADVHKGVFRMAWQFELTDTFAGESNYSWVKRAWTDSSSDERSRSVLRRAKRWAGMTGERCNVSHFGDAIHAYSKERCVVLFVQWIDPEHAQGDKV